MAGVCDGEKGKVANEGKLVAICPPEDADRLLAAAFIGTVREDAHHFVTMETRLGGQRMVDWLSGEQIPRIC